LPDIEEDKGTTMPSEAFEPASGTPVDDPSSNMLLIIIAVLLAVLIVVAIAFLCKSR
jgi:hypothetical protein